MRTVLKIKQSIIPKTINLYIYDEVKGDGWNWYTGEKTTSETSANFFRDRLAEIGEIDNINIYINSAGGSVQEGIGIYNQLKRHKAYKTVYVDGYACSVASVIAMAGDKVIMPKNTLMMIHNAEWGCWGNSADLRKCANDLDVINSASIESYLMKAGDKLTPEKLTELLDAGSWLKAEQCIDIGLADEFANEDADMEKAKAIFESAQQSVVMQMSALCPAAKVQSPSIPVVPNEPAPLPVPQERSKQSSLLSGLVKMTK